MTGMPMLAWRRDQPTVAPEDAYYPGEAPTGSGWRSRWTGRRVALVAGVALGLIAAATGGFVWSQNGGDAVAVQRPEVTFGLHPLDPGEKFSLGSMWIEDPGGDLEILEVRPITSPNVEYLGAITIWPRDYATSSLDVGNGFPAPQQPHHHPAIGVVVPAAEFTYVDPKVGKPAALFVTAGFRIREGDVGAVNGVTVVYRVGGAVKRTHFRHAAIACVKPHRCESTEKDPKIDFADEVLYGFGLIPRPSGLDR
ncbi:MAG: hypothetical protein ACT4QG_05680 [Sporichthyaceae bacterium]